MPLSEVDCEAAGAAAGALGRKCIACSQTKSKDNYSKRQWGAKPAVRKCCACVSGESEKENASVEMDQEKTGQRQEAENTCDRCGVKVTTEGAECGECKGARYCSRACLDEDKERHKAMCFKVQGNLLFSKGHFRDAAQFYRKGSDAARAQEFTTSRSISAGTETPELLVVLLSNEAQCYLNLHDYMLAMRTADEALAHNPAHVKSRNRLTLARQALGSAEAAEVRKMKAHASKFQKATLDMKLHYRNTVFPADLPTVQVYQRLIDAYRVGLREEFISGGAGDLKKCGLRRKLWDSVLGVEEAPLEEGPIQHFMRFVARGRSTEPDSEMSDFEEEEEGVLEQTVSALPLWWDDTDDARVKEMALHDAVFGIGVQFDDMEIDRRYARVKSKSWHPDGPQRGYDCGFRMSLRDLAQDIGFYEGHDSDDDDDDDDDSDWMDEDDEEGVDGDVDGSSLVEHAPERAPESAMYRVGRGVKASASDSEAASGMAQDWWAFDASAYQVNGRWQDGRITVANWARCGPWPHCRKLHLNIAGTYSLRGIDSVFAGLTALVVDDEEECARVGYDLKALAQLAPTLRHLELRMSGQWMAEGSDCLAPLAALSRLRSLRVERLRDGERCHMQTFAKLASLEHLWYSGNNTDYAGSAGGRDACHHLDLSPLSQLKAVVFEGAEFCDVSERPPEANPPKKKRSAPKKQCLSVPATLGSITFVGPDTAGSGARRERELRCSDVLRTTLVEQGVQVELTPDLRKFAESWREVVINGSG